MTLIGQYYDGYYKASGGVETYITDITKNLEYEFEILTDAIPGYPLLEKTSRRVTIRRFKPYNYALTPYKTLQTKKILFPYRVLTDTIRMKNKHKHLKEVTYDLVHFHGSGVGGALTRLSYKLKSLKLVETLTDFSYVEPKLLTVHGLSCLMTDNLLVKEEEMNFINQFENIICVDERLYIFLRENFTDKRIWHVPNSVDIKRFEFIPLSKDKNLRVGFIGRLEKSRGISLLNDLIINLPPYVELYVLGAGNSTDIEKFKSQVDITKIHFETNVRYEEIHEVYRNFDVLLNPVIAEGISRVTLEAMSSGRPVIMLNKGNRYPVINEKTGYLINYNINELLRLLQYLHESDNELKGVAKNARETVKKEYSKEVVIPNLKRIYMNLID
ncbi:Glycosyltransferase involved in cell wall bisynthesis [Candidatus Methanophagaceae archaeon]|nr:Glycosyltransferase involved in cell wall bisynthesis [Methanophagales archaeon]